MLKTPSGKPRARALGIQFGGRPGVLNSITDVPGVEVGYATLISGAGPRIVGHGPVRTGVTALFPRGRAAGFLQRLTDGGVQCRVGNRNFLCSRRKQKAGHPHSAQRKHGFRVRHVCLIFEPRFCSLQRMELKPQ